MLSPFELGSISLSQTWRCKHINFFLNVWTISGLHRRLDPLCYLVSHLSWCRPASCLLRIRSLFSPMSCCAAFSHVSLCYLLRRLYDASLFCCLVSHLPYRCRSAAFLDVTNRDPLLSRRVSHLSLSPLMSPIAILYCLAELSHLSPSPPMSPIATLAVLPRRVSHLSLSPSVSPIATFCCLFSQRLFFLSLERESSSFILLSSFFAEFGLFLSFNYFFCASFCPSFFLAGGLRLSSYASFQFRLFTSNFPFTFMIFVFSFPLVGVSRLFFVSSSFRHLCTLFVPFVPLSTHFPINIARTVSSCFRVENVLTNRTSTCCIPVSFDLFLSLKHCRMNGEGQIYKGCLKFKKIVLGLSYCLSKLSDNFFTPLFRLWKTITKFLGRK